MKKGCHMERMRCRIWKKERVLMLYLICFRFDVTALFGLMISNAYGMLMLLGCADDPVEAGSVQ